ncbi:Ubiquitin fusion degradation UFD1 family protein [Gossypium australe]|uniref:Ubiquitin fusion degradation UFD1 family protein n=1 Tax=Gossypium australe TaxID=47621 RepID=A0A5B6VYG6_9ROSI|nr:Ubiquitin fusion degradation UFD1 family protein [Gossypium australe]
MNRQVSSRVNEERRRGNFAIFVQRGRGSVKGFETRRGHDARGGCGARMQHQALDCSLHLNTSQFCGDMVQAESSVMDARDRLRGLSEHESICGSRTAPCNSCGRSIMLKDMDIHLIAVHQNECQANIAIQISHANMG